MRYPIHPLAEIFPPLADVEYKLLKDDIAEHGLKYPVILHNGMILDGKHRQQVCQDLGIELTTKAFDEGDPLTFVVRTQVGRRNLNETQRALAAARLSNMKVGRPQEEKAQICAISQPDAAEALNVSRRSTQSAQAVLDKAPEFVPLMEQGRVSVDDAAFVARSDATQEERQAVLDDVTDPKARKRRTLKSAFQEKRKRALKDNPRPIPEGQYRVAVIDPPWEVTRYNQDTRDETELDYPTMNIEEIKKLPVASHLADDAWVFLWTIQPYLPESYRIISEWGLRYRFTMTWDKGRYGTRHPALPQYNSEFVVCASRGNPQFIDTRGFFACFQGAYQGHSVKPDEFYDMIRSACEAPRIDLFNRRPIEGFEVWGNQAQE